MVKNLPANAGDARDPGSIPGLGRCPGEGKGYPLLLLLLLLLRRFSRVRLCATPQTAAHQALLSLGFSRQEYWSGLPFPSPVHESERESEVAQSCPTLRDPMDCSLPGSSVRGIFQARVLEWVAIAFSNFKRIKRAYKRLMINERTKSKILSI